VNYESAANFNKAQSSLNMGNFNNSYRNQATMNVQEKNQRATGGFARAGRISYDNSLSFASLALVRAAVETPPAAKPLLRTLCEMGDAVSSSVFFG